MIKNCPDNDQTTVISDDLIKSVWISLTMSDQLIHGLVDTGSSISLINKALARKLGMTEDIVSCNKTVSTASNPYEIKEKIYAKFKSEDYCTNKGYTCGTTNNISYC